MGSMHFPGICFCYSTSRFSGLIPRVMFSLACHLFIRKMIKRILRTRDLFVLQILTINTEYYSIHISRLQNVIHKVVDKDQTAYTKGVYVVDMYNIYIRLINDVY